jgi:quercetin dioxygenase-like cupin family protein
MQVDRRARWAVCVAATCAWAVPLASGQSRTDAHGFIAAQPEDLQPREGATQVVVLGDPSKPGIYVVRNTFAPGRGSRPHFHSQDRYVTVIKGTWWVALGPDAAVYDPAKMKPMKAGSFVLHPAGGHHFDGARDEEAVVQIMGMGPVTTTQLEPASRPRP